MKIIEKLKNFLSFKWLSKLLSGEWFSTATGTTLGAGFGTAIAAIWGTLGDQTKKILLERIFYIPPRAELMKIIHKLKPKARKFWESMFKKAKEDASKPSENDTVSAWCKLLLLRKERFPLKDEKGNPVLFSTPDGKKEPIYFNKPGLTGIELLELLTDVANHGEESFWIWTDELIHDPWVQRIQVASQKLKEGLKAFWKWFKEIIGDTDIEIAEQERKNRENIDVLKKKYKKRRLNISL